MRKIRPLARYFLAPFFNNIGYLAIYILGYSILILFLYANKPISSYQILYQQISYFNFILIFTISAGIVGNEFMNSHIELIFTKPIRKESFFIYKFFTLILLWFFLLIISLISGFVIIYHSIPNFSKLLSNCLIFIVIDGITAFCFLFFLSSWTKGSQNVIFYFLIFFAYHLKENAVEWKKYLLPFQSLFLIKKSGLLFVTYLFFYDLILFSCALLIIKRKEMIVR